ncbi:MAG: peptidoglycan-binding domain-containing protein [Chthoniobacterales bacterium]
MAFFFWNGPPAYARGGGGHGGGGGGGHGGFSGGHASMGHGYSGGGHVYSGGSAMRSYSGYGSRYSSAGIQWNPYGSRGAFRSGTNFAPVTSHQYVSGTGSGINRTHQFAGVNQGRHTVNPALQSRRSTVAGSSAVTVRNNWARHHPANSTQFGLLTQQRLHNWHGRTSTFAQAQSHHNLHNGHHHGHDWWHHHCDAIILVGGGYWGWYDGWWYPAWGYDPYYSSYDYDGPIYGYDGLPPDEAVANVQSELQRLGYNPGPADGILGPATREALRRYQNDRGLTVTGAIDPETVRSLRLG